MLLDVVGAAAGAGDAVGPAVGDEPLFGDSVVRELAGVAEGRPQEPESLLDRGEQTMMGMEAQRQGIVGKLLGSIDNAPVYAMAITLFILAIGVAVLAFKEAPGVEAITSVMAAIIRYFVGITSK